MTTLTVFDAANLQVWSQKVSVCDANGFLIDETITYDDGRVRTAPQVDGVMTEMTWSDPSDVRVWTSFCATFSAATGQLSAKTVTMDDATRLRRPTRTARRYRASSPMAMMRLAGQAKCRRLTAKGVFRHLM